MNPYQWYPPYFAQMCLSALQRKCQFGPRLPNFSPFPSRPELPIGLVNPFFQQGLAQWRLSYDKLQLQSSPVSKRSAPVVKSHRSPPKLPISPAEVKTEEKPAKFLLSPASITTTTAESPDNAVSSSTGFTVTTDEETKADLKAKTFACLECGKVFNAHYNLTRHMPVHTGARPFVCKVNDISLMPY